MHDKQQVAGARLFGFRGLKSRFDICFVQGLDIGYLETNVQVPPGWESLVRGISSMNWRSLTLT